MLLTIRPREQRLLEEALKLCKKQLRYIGCWSLDFLSPENSSEHLICKHYRADLCPTHLLSKLQEISTGCGINDKVKGTKTNHFFLAFATVDYDIIVLPETWLRSNVGNSELPSNYSEVAQSSAPRIKCYLTRTLLNGSHRSDVDLLTDYSFSSSPKNSSLDPPGCKPLAS